MDMKASIHEKMAGRSRRGLLMAEFSIGVYSDGRVDWGELRPFVRPRAVDARRLVGRLEAAGRRR